MNHANKTPQHLREVLRGKTNYPLGALVYFGPDDRTITKIVAIILPSAGSNPLLKSWQGTGISTDKQVATEIGAYFQENLVGEVVMTEGVVGCPHEEGIDYPAGASCPHCPFWDKVP